MMSRMPHTRFVIVGLALWLGLALASCQADKGSVPPSVESITVSAPTATLEYGQTVQLGAAARARDGSVLSGSPISWTSSNAAVAAVASSGLTTAGPVRAGVAETVTITASSAGKSGSVSLSVRPIPVATITPSLAQFALYVGQTAQLGATLRDVTGEPLTGRTLAWASSSPAVATVSDAGLVAAIAPGTSTITVTSEGKAATATVTVAAVPVARVTITATRTTLMAGETTQLRAVARDSSGQPLTGRREVWSSSAPSIASVSTQGLVTAIAVGAATIRATVEGKTDSVGVAVTRAIPSVSVGPWTTLGPRLIPWWNGKNASGKLQAFAAAQSDPRVMYVGGGPDRAGPYTQSGIYKTIDAGQTWTQIGASLRDRAVNALWVNASDPRHVLAATEFDGVHRSIDGGSTWQLTLPARANDLASDDRGALYAATSRGLMVSTDGGRVWSAELPGLFQAVASGGGSAILAGDINGNIVYRSNAAASWSTVLRTPGGTLYDLAVDQQTGEDLYVAAYRPNAPGNSWFVSNDRGLTWREETIAFQCPQGIATSSTARHVYFACNGSMYRSTDRGRTRQPVEKAIFDNQSMYVTNAGGSDQLIAASDHGVWRSGDQGATWTNLTESLPVAIVNGLAVRGATIVTAVQDFSAQMSFDNGRTWTSWDAGDRRMPSGEVGMALINPGNASYCYVVTTSGYHHSTDGCRTWTRAADRRFTNKPWTPGGVGTNVIAVDPSRPNVVYTFSSYEGNGTSAVYRSIDWGVTFAATGWPVGTPAAIAIAPSDSNRIVVTSIEPDRSTVISVSADGGRSWKQHRPSQDFQFGAAIAIDPNDRDLIIVGSSNVAAAGGGVLRSIDGGTTWVSANVGMSTEVRLNRYGIGTTALRFNGESVLAMATTNGVYVSSDLGATWRDVSGNSISRFFTDVAWDGSSLYSSSFGSGVQRATVTTAAPRRRSGAAPLAPSAPVPLTPVKRKP